MSVFVLTLYIYSAHRATILTCLGHLESYAIVTSFSTSSRTGERRKNIPWSPTINIRKEQTSRCLLQSLCIHQSEWKDFHRPQCWKLSLKLSIKLSIKC